jgi:hypothetical protein
MTTIGDPAGSAPARVWFALAVAASVFAPAAVFQASAQAEGRYALVVGVEKYNPRFLVPLDHAEDDMERVGKALERLGFNVVAMTSAAEIPERRPVTAADILAEVDRRLKSRDPADTIVLAFSGHGVQLKRDGEGDDRETWFCPERARLDEPATLLPLSQVVARLKACPAKQKLLLVDACRVEVEPKEIRDKSGVPAIELDAAAPFRRQLPEGMAALFSCGPHQKSFELPDTGGVFTHYVVEYLEGRADPARYRRGEATVQELAAYVARETTDHVDQRLREDQVPELVLPGGRLTDWPLGRLADLASVDRKPEMERSLPAVPPAGPRPPAGAALPRAIKTKADVTVLEKRSINLDDQGNVLTRGDRRLQVKRNGQSVEGTPSMGESFRVIAEGVTALKQMNGGRIPDGFNAKVVVSRPDSVTTYRVNPDVVPDVKNLSPATLQTATNDPLTGEAIRSLRDAVHLNVTMVDGLTTMTFKDKRGGGRPLTLTVELEKRND